MDATNNWKKRCNFCGEDIAHNSRRCPYCGGLVGDSANNINDVNNAGTKPAEGYNGMPANAVPVDETGNAGMDTQQVPAGQDTSYNINEGQNQVNQEGVNQSVTYENQDAVSGYGTQIGPQGDSQSNPQVSPQVNPYSRESADYATPGAVNNRENIRPDMKVFYGYQNNSTVSNPLGNGIKVFLTVISTIPWIGQLVGIIAAIVFMNSDDDRDRKSFGLSLLIASLILFVVVSCFGCLAAMIISES